MQLALYRVDACRVLAYSYAHAAAIVASTAPTGLGPGLAGSSPGGGGPARPRGARDHGGPGHSSRSFRRSPGPPLAAPTHEAPPSTRAGAV